MAKKKKLTPIEVTPTRVNGIQDPGAAAAMDPKTVVVPAKKRTGSKGKPGKPAKPVHPKAKITFRHNILPPLIGILAAVEILAILNAQWVSAQYQYYFSKPAPVTNISESPENPNPKSPARIYIPRLNLEAPVVTDEKSFDEGRVQTALQRGTLQFGGSADPGQIGNLVIVGHSSGQLWSPGDYKFVFTLLDKLEKDDRIMVDFKGKRYIYRVVSEKVVPPTDVSVLKHGDEPQLTLITCTPVGTSKDRLIITARQVSPDPATAAPLPPESLNNVRTPVIPY